MSNLFFDVNNLNNINSNNDYFCIKNMDYNKLNLYNTKSTNPEQKFWFRMNNTKIKKSNFTNLNIHDNIILTLTHNNFINFLDKLKKDLLEKLSINLNTMLIIEDFGYKYIKTKTNKFKVYNQNNIIYTEEENYDYYEKNLDIVLELNEIMINNFNEGWIFWKIIQAKEIKIINYTEINLFEETEINIKPQCVRPEIKHDITTIIPQNIPMPHIQTFPRPQSIPLVPVSNMINPMMLLNQLSKLKKVDNENKEEKNIKPDGNLSFTVQLNKVQVKEPKDIKEIYSDIKKSEKEYDKLLILENFNRIINEHKLFQKKIRKKIKKQHKKYKKIKKAFKKI